MRHSQITNLPFHLVDTYCPHICDQEDLLPNPSIDSKSRVLDELKVIWNQVKDSLCLEKVAHLRPHNSRKVLVGCLFFDIY